jgi:pimeloyl-ACP methyl ester carboxylesterase
MNQFETPVRGMRFSGLATGPTGGPPVLLLHGFPEFADCWRPLLGHLAAAGYRGVAVDQRGYSEGARPQSIVDYSLAELVADAIAVAGHHFNGKPFHLVGHDWGGAVAWALAARARERVRTLTILSTPHPTALVEAIADPASDQGERSRYIGHFRRPKHAAESGLLADGARMLYAIHTGIDRGQVDATVARLTANGAAALTGGLNWYRASGLTEAIGPIGTRTLYLWGTEDPALGRDAALRTAAHVTGDYRFVALAGAGHWLPELETDRVLPELLPHLGR